MTLPKFMVTSSMQPWCESGPIALVTVASGVNAKYIAPPHHPSWPALNVEFMMRAQINGLVWWYTAIVVLLAVLFNS
jgi:hypothetical protein